jgi:hypothetical protein
VTTPALRSQIASPALVSIVVEIPSRTASPTVGPSFYFPTYAACLYIQLSPLCLLSTRRTPSLFQPPPAHPRPPYQPLRRLSHYTAHRHDPTRVYHCTYYPAQLQLPPVPNRLPPPPLIASHSSLPSSPLLSLRPPRQPFPPPHPLPHCTGSARLLKRSLCPASPLDANRIVGGTTRSNL